MAAVLTHNLRADAQENRDRIVEVAREVFATQGLGVSMREVARRAGVGPATLYRRFPTKKDLVLESFLDEFHTCRSIVDDGCADPDAWRGFCSVIERLALLNAENHGFTEAFMAEYPQAVDVVSHRAEALRDLAGLAVRAQREGRLRRDFVIDDLVLFLSADRGLDFVAPDVRARATRRFTALMIDAFRASPSNSRLPSSPPLARRTVLTSWPTGGSENRPKSGS